ncbi:MAG TPA: tripartite tricarboxylate transporter substrate binding protein [Candidimonas sp.]|nr:tripartite tricarboxylate transporter substrate binding protein [Candidimonas sp.]
MKKTIITCAVVGISMLAMAPPAMAAWPDRPITVIVPFPAGGGTDTFARPLAQQLGEQLGKSVVVDNRGGAGGTLGAGVAARAVPDGYTFFMGGAHHAVAPSIYKKLTYDIQKDFVPVALLAQPPQVIVVNPKKLPVKNIKEFLEAARKTPGLVNFGSAGVGSTHHLAGELFALKTGLKLTHVPYQGAGPMLTGLITGQVDVAFDGLGSSASHIRAGTIRPLAVAAAARSPSMPEVPTVAEAGVAGYEVSTWYAMWAPAGTPPDIVDKMATEITRALEAQKIKALWASNGTAIPKLTGADFGKFVDSEIVRWAEVVKEAGVQPQ